jgi:hypothetical protein
MDESSHLRELLHAAYTRIDELEKELAKPEACETDGNDLVELYYAGVRCYKIDIRGRKEDL